MPTPTPAALLAAADLHAAAASAWLAADADPTSETAADAALVASDDADAAETALALAFSPLPDSDENDGGSFAAAHAAAAAVLRDLAAVLGGDHPRTLRRAAAALRLVGWVVRKTPEGEFRVGPKGNADAAYFGATLHDATQTAAAELAAARFGR